MRTVVSTWQLSGDASGELEVTEVNRDAATFSGLRRTVGAPDRDAMGQFTSSDPDSGVYSAVIDLLAFTGGVAAPRNKAACSACKTSSGSAKIATS